MGTLLSAVSTTQMVDRIGDATRGVTQSISRLSTGLRVVSAKDDAAGSAVANGLMGTTRSLRAAARAAHAGVSVTQIADGATGDVGDVLMRMRELAVQASRDTLNDNERGYVHDEYAQLVHEIDRTAGNTRWGDLVLTDGSQATMSVQVGTGASADHRIEIELGDLRSATLGIDGLDLSSAATARDAIALLDDALDTTLGYRSAYGAVANRLEHAAAYAEGQTMAFADATSRLVDADIAHEASELVRYKLVQEASVAALGQAQRVDRDATEGLLLAGLTVG
ncbi:MAG: flagellin FliC [Myxococcales bacterium]|nr:flagellin FliC [Myxococcales bacterium]